MSRQKTGLSLGVTTLMTTFVALSMAIFATLSLLSASQDYELTKRQADASRGYYAADSAAEQRMADITAAAEAALKDSGGAESFFTALSHSDILWDTFEHRGRTAKISFSLPAGEERELRVTCRISYDEAARRISTARERWQLISTAGPEPGEGLNIWEGPEDE